MANKNPDQTRQNATSDQDLYCLVTEVLLIFEYKKNENYHAETLTLYMRKIGNSIRYTWVGCSYLTSLMLKHRSFCSSSAYVNGFIVEVNSLAAAIKTADNLIRRRTSIESASIGTKRNIYFGASF